MSSLFHSIDRFLGHRHATPQIPLAPAKNSSCTSYLGGKHGALATKYGIDLR